MDWFHGKIHGFRLIFSRKNQSIEGIVPPISAEEAPDLITGSALHAARRLRQQGAKFGLDGEQMVGLPAKMLGLPA